MAEPVHSGSAPTVKPVQWDPRLSARAASPRRAMGAAGGLFNGRNLLIAAGVIIGLFVIGNIFGDRGDPGSTLPTNAAASETVDSIRVAEARAGYPGIQIEIAGSTLTLFGTVATPADKAAVEAVARSVVGTELAISSQLVVTDESVDQGPAAGVTQADVTLQNRLSTLMARQPIIFESASSEIAIESVPVLDNLAAELTLIPNAGVVIAGHTDSDGEEEANLALSQARAEAVLTHLVGLGIDATRLTAQGFGETRPIADNVSQEGKAANRRIEILVQPS